MKSPTTKPFHKYTFEARGHYNKICSSDDNRCLPDYVERIITKYYLCGSKNEEVVYRDYMSIDRYNDDESPMRDVEMWLTHGKVPTKAAPLPSNIEKGKYRRTDHCNFFSRFQMFWRKVFG